MKKALLSTIAMLVLSLTLLAGTTFAWFSQKQVSNDNTMTFGTFKMELEIQDADEPGDEWYPYLDGKSLFEHTKHYNGTVVQPGMTFTKKVKVKNMGQIDFGFTYKISNFDPEIGKLVVEYNE